MILVVAALFGVVLVLGLFASLRMRNLNRWLGSYVRQTRKRLPPRPGEPVHLLLCIADHFEPDDGDPGPLIAQARVDRWVREYPGQFGAFRDNDGRPPQHTFFYPLERYQSTHLDALAGLCRDGFGEVEVHLHHDGDTATSLRKKLLEFKELLARRHGLLSRERRSGELAYAFIHGFWALDNSRPDGRLCGVNNELDVLRETGCYADLTLPSAPNPTQTRKINSIYYACDDPERPKSHDWGSDVGAGPAPANALLMIQGPLLFNWKNCKGGLLPRIENGCLQASQPPTPERLQLWLRARVQVPTRPDWFFVKLHTHGAQEVDRPLWFGEPMVRFHQTLAKLAQENPNFHFHYVTAREMVNLVRAAEAGWTGSVAAARDYQLVWNGGRPEIPASLPENPGGVSLRGTMEKCPG